MSNIPPAFLSHTMEFSGQLLRLRESYGKRRQTQHFESRHAKYSHCSYFEINTHFHIEFLFLVFSGYEIRIDLETNRKENYPLDMIL